MTMRKKLSPEEFVRLWQGAPSATVVANEMGLSIGAVTSRAHMYRMKGIPLKFFRPERMDRQRLAELAKTLMTDGR